jgi:hypothetical protein
MPHSELLGNYNISAATTLLVVEIKSAAACDPDQEARAHVALVEREPGYSSQPPGMS